MSPFRDDAFAVSRADLPEQVAFTNGQRFAWRMALSARVPPASSTRDVKDGMHHHFELTEDVDADGFVVAIEVPQLS